MLCKQWRSHRPSALREPLFWGVGWWSSGPWAVQWLHGCLFEACESRVHAGAPLDCQLLEGRAVTSIHPSSLGLGWAGASARPHAQPGPCAESWWGGCSLCSHSNPSPPPCGQQASLQSLSPPAMLHSPTPPLTAAGAWTHHLLWFQGYVQDILQQQLAVRYMATSMSWGHAQGPGWV